MLAKKKKSMKIPGVGLLYKLGVKPNHITLVGLLLAFIAFFMPLVPAMILFALSFIMDLLDGNLARRYNLKSAFGGFFDSTADKIVEILFVAYLANLYAVQSLGMLAVGLSIMISYVKHRANLELHSFFDRAERLIYLIILVLFFGSFAPTAFIIYNVLCGLAITQLVIKVSKQL